MDTNRHKTQLKYQEKSNSPRPFLSGLSYPNPISIFFKDLGFFNINNKEDMILASKLEEISSQFLELEQLVKSNNESPQVVQQILGGIICEVVEYSESQPYNG